MTDAEEYLDEKFPKGDKRRGEAMCLLALAKAEMPKETVNKTFERGRAKGRQEVLKDILEIIKWLKESVEWNAHDTAWIEKTIEKLQQISEGKK